MPDKTFRPGLPSFKTHREQPCSRALWAWTLLYGALGFVVVEPTRADVPAAPPHRYEIQLASQLDSLWVAVGEKNLARGESGERKDENLNWLATLDPTTGQVRTLGPPIAQTGSIVKTTIAGQYLYFFTDAGQQHHYTRDSNRPELRLPDHTVPEAITGDTDTRQPRVYAVVRAVSAQAIARDWADRQRSRATQPAASEPAGTDSQPASVGAAAAFHVVRYGGTGWEPVVAASPIPAGANRVWIAVSGGRIHVLWQVPHEEQQVDYAWHEAGRWERGPSIPLLAEPREPTFTIANNQLVFMRMLVDRNRPDAWICRGSVRPVETDRPNLPWIEVPPLELKSGGPLQLPEGSQAIGYKDLVAIVRPAGERVELGLWPITGGPPRSDFQPVPLSRVSLEPVQKGLRDLKSVALVGVLLLLLFVRRRVSLTDRVVLPPGYALANIGRRTIAALIDMLPAAIIVYLFWHEQIHATIEEMRAVVDSRQSQEMWPDAIFWPSLAGRLIYLGYCFAFELMWSRTPGKWLLRCEVISETGEVPVWHQILFRNAVRVIEFDPHPPLAIPLLLVVFLTRNRQRVGDLLGRTIVIERSAAPPAEGEEKQE